VAHELAALAVLEALGVEGLPLHIECREAGSEGGAQEAGRRRWRSDRKRGVLRGCANEPPGSYIRRRGPPPLLLLPALGQVQSEWANVERCSATAEPRLSPPPPTSDFRETPLTL